MQTLDDTERMQIQHALAVTGGHRTKAAKLLAIDRNTLRAKMKRHGLSS